MDAIRVTTRFHCLMCIECGHDAIPFADILERLDWLKKHQVATNHTDYILWTEEKPNG